MAGGGAGDVATWVGSAGTWVVGAVAGIIAYQQYRRDKFRPAVAAFRDDDRRIVVQIINRGAGTGLISDVNLLPPDHPRQSVKFYQWEIDGKKDEKLTTYTFHPAGPSDGSARPSAETGYGI